MDPRTHRPLLGTVEWLVNEQTASAPLGAALLSESLYANDPVRKGHQYPRQRNVHGHYWCASIERHVWHESLLERASMMLLDHAGDVVAMASQPMKLTVGEWWHVPDLLVLHRDGTQSLIDVKPSSLLSEHAREQFAQTAAICEQVGWNYRVLTERTPQVRVNLAFLGEFRQTEHALDNRCMAVVSAYEPGWRLRDIVDRMPGATVANARTRAMRVLWERLLVVDLSERLTDESPVALPAAFGLEAVDGII